MALLNKFCSIAMVAAGAALCKSSGVRTMDLSTVTAGRLHGEIGGSDVESKPNFIFSPLSIFDVFHAAQRGAKGETKTQMDALVGPKESFALPELIQPQSEDNKVIVDIANRMYVHPELAQNKVFEEFRKELEKEKHSAEILNFADSAAAAAKMNAFVAETTKHHITNLIDPSAIGALTRLVLINALYFKAPWLSQFKDSETITSPFFAPAGPKSVKMMKGKLDKGPLLYTIRKEGTAVGLPYADPRLRLYVFMPEDLKGFETAMAENPEIVESIISEMEGPAHDKAFNEEIHITMPKFKLSAESNKVDLGELFSRMGAPDMFDMTKADFSGISGDKNLFVSSFVHQADIDVNEEGTEATAATAMVMMTRSLPMRKTQISIDINKPFVFQLRFVDGDTNLTLFSGRLADPEAAQH